MGIFTRGIGEFGGSYRLAAPFLAPALHLIELRRNGHRPTGCGAALRRLGGLRPGYDRTA
jgi:hypothetical protein